ncbi:unnamed protein product [Notodromas monacha]|uniref:Uncharacterized protein n=2 Tax=Notodromas monacha TaxID=399045 RepID=A0A7R9C1V3_9CRUS|nr:unnamed protein product [Notodromas monacha]CAG0924549.1 unnamed protein product [Notodromas monacha]
MAVPMAFHAAHKVRENMNKPLVMANEAHEENASGADGHSKFKFFEGSGNVMVRRYNEKMMNAIWGLYNRNSAHNLKSNVDGGEVAQVAPVPLPPPSNNV